MEVVEYELIRDWSVGDRPCREWWAVLGTVAEALDGLTSCDVEVAAGAAGAAEVVEDELGTDFDCEALRALKYEGGKCFALYVSCTPASNCTRQIKLQQNEHQRTLNAFLYRFTLSPKLP
jgi:hypothetical protein